MDITPITLLMREKMREVMDFSPPLGMDNSMAGGAEDSSKFLKILSFKALKVKYFLNNELL